MSISVLLVNLASNENAMDARHYTYSILGVLYQDLRGTIITTYRKDCMQRVYEVLREDWRRPCPVYMLQPILPEFSFRPPHEGVLSSVIILCFHAALNRRQRVFLLHEGSIARCKVSSYQVYAYSYIRKRDG